jgi:mRNA interferase MazF
MKTGDIILVPFPYAEMRDIKVRPAVVIAETADKYNDLIIAAISSVIPQTINKNEIILQPNSMNNLRAISVIKVDRIFTLKKDLKIADLGKLNREELHLFIKTFQNLV